MPFCMNCGQQLPERAKFCSGCGTAMGEVKSEETQRQQEWAGNIIKCPSCGEDIPSFTAICPACGHEISSAKVSSALKEFIDEINECDKIIANTPKKELPKKGWKTWKKSTRILWVIFNIITSCIPLVIYLTLPLFKPLLRSDVSSKLLPMEQRKVALIENFTFPNDRESVLEAMLFVKSKMAFLASEKANEKNAFWLRLWNTKATQLHQKANILLKNDTIAETAYSDIISSKKMVDKKVCIRAGIGLIIIAIFIAFVIFNGSLWVGLSNIISNSNNDTISHQSNEDIQAKTAKYTWPQSELTARIPKPSINTGEVWNNSDSEFWLILQGVTTEDYLEYIDACKEKGFIIDTEKTDMFFEAYDSDGYYLKLSYLDFMEELDIKITKPRTNENLEWPTVGLATLIPKPQGTKGKITIDTHIQFFAYIGEMSKEDYNEYVNECIEKGFNVEYSKYDKVYSAKNKKGDSIRIEYEGNNTISISMYAHD